MGVFDIFKRKTRQNNEAAAVEEPVERPKIYSGMRVEVTTFNDFLLFVGKIQELRGSTAKLFLYSETPLASDSKPFRARIRGYNDHEKKAIYMEGVISPQPHNIWYVADLTVESVVDDRAFFRLDMDIDATLTTYEGHEEEAFPCKLINISIGGACVASNHPYGKGDRFLLKVKLLEDRSPSVLYCRILRITEKEKNPDDEDTYKYEYGCKFVELPDTDQGQIAQNIFAAQSKRRKFTR